MIDSDGDEKKLASKTPLQCVAAGLIVTPAGIEALN